MQTALADFIKDTAKGQEADTILRACVHCGFCTATCPTYQLLGDELDGPRGRIYQIKQVLEGATATSKMQLHTDRCLTCRSCETTCPSGVQYGRLLDIGRELIEDQVTRPWWQRLQRQALLTVLPYPQRLKLLLKLAYWPALVLPKKLRDKIPVVMPELSAPVRQHTRQMLVLDGCVQSVSAPNINHALATVLDKLQIQVIRPQGAGCCGALPMHLSKADKAKVMARQNIDAWWPALEAGAEAIVVTASGCGVHVHEYGHLLADDINYADKAARISTLCKDPIEILSSEDLSAFKPEIPSTIAFHAPCTLQHGLKLTGQVEKLLEKTGFSLTSVKDAHLCCGSAGTYSVFQPDLATRLQSNKIKALNAGRPSIIATANIGCLMHLQQASEVPVVHWLQLLTDTE